MLKKKNEEYSALVSPGTGLTQLRSLPWQLSAISIALSLEGWDSVMAQKWHGCLSKDLYYGIVMSSQMVSLLFASLKLDN